MAGSEAMPPFPVPGWFRCVHQHPSAQLLRRAGANVGNGPRAQADWSPELTTYRSRISWLLRNLHFAVEEVHEGDAVNRYAYTVGLSLFEAPELIVFGLPTEAAVPLLVAAAYEGIDMAEDVGSDTAEVSGLLERFPIGIQQLSAPERYLTVAHTLWNEWAPVGEKAPFRAVRLVLVDEDGVPDMGHALAAVDGSILPPPPAVGS